MEGQIKSRKSRFSKTNPYPPSVGSQIDLHILCKSCVRTLSDQSECCNSARNDELAALFSFNQSPKTVGMYMIFIVVSNENSIAKTTDTGGNNTHTY